MSSLSPSEAQKDVPGISNSDTNVDNFNNENVREKFLCIKPEGKVLVLYTGGTIGMLRNKEGVLRPVIDEFITALRNFPQLHDSEYASRNYSQLGESHLVLPETAADNRRVIYKISKFSNVCDSSNITMDDWIHIAKYIKKCYDNYDGFVILHGTDTLGYTASALSFMFEDLGKPVILTGSQMPIFHPRSDGLDNFLASLVIAASYNIPEVCVFFGTNLMRGNRTSKISACSFDAFQSPNCLPLATAHIKIKVEYGSFFRPCTLQKFDVHTSLNQNVGLLRLFPGITYKLVKAFLQPPIEGVVLQSYGSGNIPTNRRDIINVLAEAAARGVIIVNITQCMTGSVSDVYEAGKLLREAGVTSGFDMTPEAALTKLAYVLSKSEWDTETKRLMMETNLRGELTSGRLPNTRDYDLLKAVEQSLRLSSTEGFQDVKSYLLPAMMNDAAIKRDITKLKQLKEYVQ
ncbi:L-asparaginase [Harpegnathos saltator]|uniref:asparaginase n=1 Tax=Harpegnathos saltator TaxID=610380 RepID=E2C0K9_HARSA|nr:L-asparaginase [Harpegnathos saltator]